MTTSHDPDRLLAAYLADGMDALPDRVIDAVLDEAHRTRQRAVLGPWRTPIVNNMLKLALGAAAVVVLVVAGITFLPGDRGGVGGPAGVSPSPTISPAPAVVPPSPTPSPSQQADRLQVAGSAGLHYTADIPPNWGTFGFGASREDPAEPQSTAFFATVVDNTYEDPCAHIQRDPRIGSTVDALATALGEIPDTTATEPVPATIAGHEATYIELTLAAAVPCDPEQFYLLKESEGADWWALAADESFRVWILEVDGQRIAMVARSYPGTSDTAESELQDILDSIVFDSGS